MGAADKLAGKAKEVTGVVVVDPRTIRITIDAPKAYFLSKLSYHTFYIVDHRNVEQGGAKLVGQAQRNRAVQAEQYQSGPDRADLEPELRRWAARPSRGWSLRYAAALR